MVMKTRNIIDGNVVWFNSKGVDENGNRQHAESFAVNADSVVVDLTQKLSVLKKELWYQINYGLPLFEKVTSKAVIDSFVISIISSQAQVIKLLSFESKVENRHYMCKAQILTDFGQLSLDI